MAYISIGLLYVSKPSKNQQILLFVLACNLINQIGTVLNMQATTFEGALSGLKLAYIGKIYSIFFLLIFILKYCGITMNDVVKTVLSALHLMILGAVWTSDKHNLYYRTIVFSEDGLFPHLEVTPGIMYIFYLILINTYVIVVAVICISKLVHSKDRIQICRMLCMLSIPIIVLLSFLLFKLGVTAEYDCTSFAYLLDTIIVIIAIKKYDLVDFVSLAKEEIVDEFADAVLVLDDSKKLIYTNRQTEKLFPEIDTIKRDVILEKVEEAFLNKKELWIDDRLYAVRKKTLGNTNEEQSTLYTLTDNTVNYRLTYEDGLTGVGNRSALVHAMEALEVSDNLYFVITDIDNFKKINDTKGHQVGDEYLKYYAKLLSELFSPKSVFRYGGDEFVLLVDMSGDELEKRLNGINEFLAGQSQVDIFHVSGGYIRVDKDMKPDLFMKRADDALYEAKKLGKGRFEKAKQE